MRQPVSKWYREYDLDEARKQPETRHPLPHQAEALRRLDKWYGARHQDSAGCILVLPTGGGKTFTAARFLCSGPLSDGYKVLWLAHTHHLLEQAVDAFGSPDLPGGPLEVRTIHPPRAKLAARVVSGTVGHFRAADIKPSDDVLLMTLQTGASAKAERNASFRRWVEAAGDKLFVVFDEAHHAPARTYRDLLASLRDQSPGMHLLGLTATPTRASENDRRWLGKLFPQGIVHQVTVADLIAAQVLAKPMPQETKLTEFSPDFTDEQYRQWVRTYRDLPEPVIRELAESRQRNALIAQTYVAERKRYGKTIMFADNWRQCEMLCEFLGEDGVKAGAIYSHEDARLSSATARNARAKDENAKVLSDFRAGKLDVLVNIRMLTEGTDVPDVRTVFLTRQTTSEILLTQMVGRALRGPKLGGTREAYIVSFIDNWKQHIQWAHWEPLTLGKADATVPETYEHPPLQLISIDLVRAAARGMHGGVNVAPQPFGSMLPVGWYVTRFETLTEGDDAPITSRVIMVYDRELTAYQGLIGDLQAQPLLGFAGVAAALDGKSGPVVEQWMTKHFEAPHEHLGGDLQQHVFDIARHIAQNDGEAPGFFPFAERDDHDLDTIAQEAFARDLGPLALHGLARTEYERVDRMWRVFYPSFELYKSQLDACINRIALANGNGHDPKTHKPVIVTPEIIPVAEPDDDVKRQVKRRDGGRCLCCGATRRLEVDHLVARHHGGGNDLANLQTLCQRCNGHKDVIEMNFRVARTPLSEPSPEFRPARYDCPAKPTPAQRVEWLERMLRASINCFYRCAAVEQVTIKQRGHHRRHWEVVLNSGNDPAWLAEHLPVLVDWAAGECGFADLESMLVSAPGVPPVRAERKRS